MCPIGVEGLTETVKVKFDTSIPLGPPYGQTYGLNETLSMFT